MKWFSAWLALGLMAGCTPDNATDSGTEDSDGTATDIACGTATPEDFVSQTTLAEGVAEVARHSPNRSGDPDHEAYVDWLAEELEAMDLTVQVVEHTLEDQRITGASLMVSGSSQTWSTTPSAIPRAGLGEVSGPLVWVDEEWSNAPNVEGALVVRAMPLRFIPNDTLFGGAFALYDPDGSLAAQPEYQAGGFFQRPWMSSPVGPDLVEAESRGAVGVIYLRDLAADDLQDMWVQTALLDIPAVQLGAELGDPLQIALQAGASLQATLGVDGQRGPVTARSLWVDLPGPEEQGPVIVLQTHTDTLNPVQENAGPALLALAEHRLSQPTECLGATLRLEFSAGHRNGVAGAIDAAQRADALGDRLVGIVSVEHLGALEYLPVQDADGVQHLQASGWLEPKAISFAPGHETIGTHMLQRLEARDLSRAILLDGATGLGFFGESKVFAGRGLPTYEFIAGPWVQNSPSVGVEAVDIEDMQRGVAVLWDLVEGVVQESTAD